MPTVTKIRALTKPHGTSNNSLNIQASALVNDLRLLNKKTAKRTLLSPAELKKTQKEIYQQLGKYDKKRKLAYHNLDHTKSVVNRVQKLIKTVKINVADKQLLLIAAMYHDYEHGSSRSIRSNEERSAIQADLWAKKNGYSVEERLVLYGLIISTTFLNPSIRPETQLEKILVIADLGGFVNSTQDWLTESLNVTLESPARKRPRNLKEWLWQQKQFLNYVRHRIPAEALKLKWDKHLNQKDKVLDKMMDNPFYNKSFTPILKKIEKAIKP